MKKTGKILILVALIVLGGVAAHSFLPKKFIPSDAELYLDGLITQYYHNTITEEFANLQSKIRTNQEVSGTPAQIVIRENAMYLCRGLLPKSIQPPSKLIDLYIDSFDQELEDTSVSGHVSDKVEELFLAYRENIKYSLSNGTAVDEIQSDDFQYYSTRINENSTAIVATVDLTVSPLDILAGMTEEEVAEIWLQQEILYPNATDQELRDAHVTAMVERLLPLAQTPVYKQEMVVKFPILFSPICNAYKLGPSFYEEHPYTFGDIYLYHLMMDFPSDFFD